MKEFKAHKVDVRGLSRKEAAKKRNAAYKEFQIFRDMKEAYYEETGKGKCKRKTHVSRTFVKGNINSI